MQALRRRCFCPCRSRTGGRPTRLPIASLSENARGRPADPGPPPESRLLTLAQLRGPWALAAPD
eukprot:1020901-Alexandrium_andersonii.AAC.1